MLLFGASLAASQATLETQILVYFFYVVEHFPSLLRTFEPETDWNTEAEFEKPASYEKKCIEICQVSWPLNQFFIGPTPPLGVPIYKSMDS